MSLTGSIASPEEPEHRQDDTILRRQLVNDFGPASMFHMKVYLRVRPLNNKDFDSNKCLAVESSQSVLLTAPEQSATFRNHSSNEEKLKQRFTFTRVFRPDQDQREFFNGAVLGTVSEFVNGQNCLVFAYGTTNSGKTYTVQGSSAKPGVIPHAVEVVFNSVGNRLDNHLDLRPVNTCHVEPMSPRSLAEMMTFKESLLHGIDEFCTSLSSQCSEESDSTFELSSKDGVISELSIHESDNFRFQIWCSFAEIYNENIYDLLDNHPEQRRKLRLTLDVSGNNYIKGLKILPVNTPKEARQFLSLGRKNLRIASTKLNQCSSRSHCIFTIYMVRVVDSPDPQQAMINSLSFCDLAGSERVVKTQNTGDRLKEAGKINNSLMVFGRCIEALRMAQNSRERPIVPFRDSKLTQLFQLFFNGKGRASMIVNVSPTADMFDDTTNVLKVSAIAKQVVSDQLEKSCLNMTSASQRLTDMWTKSGQRWSSFCKGKVIPSKMSIMTVREDSVIVEEESEAEDQPVKEEPDIQELIDLVLELEGKYNALLEEKSQQEIKLRAELCQEFQTHFVNMEKAYEKRLETVKENAEEYMEKRLELAQKALLLNTKCLADNTEDDGDQDMSDEELDVLQTEKGTLESQVCNLKEEMQTKSKELESLSSKLAEEAQSKSDLILQLEDKNRQLNSVTCKLAEITEKNNANIASNADLILQLEDKSQKLDCATCKLEEITEKNSATIASMAKEIEEKILEIESLHSRQNIKRDQADTQKKMEDLKESAQADQELLVKENSRLQSSMASMQLEHARKVKQMEEQIQKFSGKLSEAERCLEQSKCSFEKKFTDLQQENGKKIETLEEDINRLTIKLTDTQSESVESELNKKVVLLEDQLQRTKHSLQLEKSNAETLKSAVLENEKLYKSSVADLEKLGDILFDKDTEISSLSSKVSDLEKEAVAHQRLQLNLESLRRENSDYKQKMEKVLREKEAEVSKLNSQVSDLKRETVAQQNLRLNYDRLRQEKTDNEKKATAYRQEMEAEVALLKAKIVTLDRIDTSDDFKPPVTRTRRRRRPANENSAPTDDSQYSSSTQGDDTLPSKSRSPKGDSKTGHKRSSPVLSARNLTDNTMRISSTKSSSDEDHSLCGETVRKQRRKMYEKDSVAPLECSPPKVDQKRSSVHSIVTRQLRSRK